MNRDARGRFVSSEEAAATLVLEAAVREAVANIRTRDGRPTWQRVRDARTSMLHAAYTAELLLGRAS